MMKFLLLSNSLLFMALVSSTMVANSWAFSGQNPVSGRVQTRSRTIAPLQDMLDGNPQWYEASGGSNNENRPMSAVRTRSATTAPPREFGDIGVKPGMNLANIRDQGILNRQLCFAAERFIKYQSGYFSPMRPHDNPNMVVNVDYNSYNDNGSGNNYLQNPKNSQNNNNYNANNSNNYNLKQLQQQQRGSNNFNNNYNNNNNNNNNNNQRQQQQQQQQRGSNINNRDYNANNNNYSQRGSYNNNNNYNANANNNNNQQRGRNRKPLSQKELELLRDQRNRSTILADDFVFKGPLIGPLNKPDYFDVVDNYFRIYEAFPDLTPNCYGFTVDVVDPLTVRFFVKATGTYQQPLEGAIGLGGGLLGKAATFMTGKPDGRRYIGATESWSITFNSLERMQVRCLRGGYVVGEAAGGMTTAQGKDSIFGILQTLGIPVPSLSDLKVQKILGNNLFKTSGSGRLFPKTSSSKNKLPRWWRDRLN